MNTLTYPLTLFRRVLHVLVAEPGRPLYLRAGVCFEPGRREWLVRDVLAAPPSRSPEPGFALFRVSAALAAPSAFAPVGISTGELQVGLAGPAAGLWGALRGEGEPAPLDCLYLAGPGMRRLAVAPLAPAQPAAPSPLALAPLYESTPPSVPLRWSRTSGGLGDPTTWLRLHGLSVAVVGCGRSGSLAAASLARLGVRRLLLVDPDHLEEHNLGEMDAVGDEDLGRPKVLALAARLAAFAPAWAASLEPIVASISSSEALTAARTCDVLFCCADDDAARLACALVAAMFHRVLVDIGTGIAFEPAGSAGSARPARTMAADVRLVVPGDGCLLCAGGLRAYRRARETLCRREVAARAGGGGWQAQRAGSLRSLNQMAVAVGVQMLQDLVAERINGTTWAHLEVGETGVLRVDYPRPAGVARCRLCGMSGMGDAGLGLRP